MRLIDAEGSELQTQLKFIREAEYQIYGGGSWGFTAKCERAIENAPTIQPEPHWIPVTEDTPDEERECWITPKTTSKVYRGIFTRHYGEWHRTGFICDEGFMWLNTALAWMYCEVPEPYKGVTT